MIDFPHNPGLLLGGYEKEFFEEMKQIADLSHAIGSESLNPLLI